MTVSRHVSTLLVDGTRYEPTSVDFTLDEDAVPYARLTATLPAGPAAVELDPRRAQRVQLTMRSDFGTGDTLAEISRRHAGDTVSALAYGDDLVTNSGFEDGLAGWEGVPFGDPDWDETIVTQSAEQAHTGDYSMQLTLVEPDANLSGAYTSPVVPVQRDFPYFAQAWLYGLTDDVSGDMLRFSLWVDFVDAAGVFLTGEVHAVSFPAEGQWHRLAVDVPPSTDPDVAGVRLAVNVPLFSETNDRAWVDDVKFGIRRGTLADITSSYGRPFNSFGMRPSTTRRANLWLRNRTVDHEAGTVTIEATSGEALLTDYTHTAQTPTTPPGGTIRDAVNYVLGRVLAAAVSTPGTGGQVVEADALPWEPGETAWSYLTSITGSARLRLWCDAVGLWHLADPELVMPARTVALGVEQATVLTDSLDREANGWADSAVVTYEWTDTAGDRQRRIDAAGPGTVAVTRTVRRPYPGRGFAAAIARKHKARGRVIQAGAVSDYDVEPLQAASITVPDTPLQAGIVSAVQWAQPDDVMTIRTRDLMSITERSWLYTPTGIAWDDVPAGITWASYQWGDF